LVAFSKAVSFDLFLAVLAVVAGEAAGVRADVAFLFKAVPCLQHQTDDIVGILDAVDAEWLVISFPTRSLGNRAKGMVETYRAMYGLVTGGRAWETRELVYPSELVFVSRKGEVAPTSC
jgi:hypothetical protein